MLHMDDIEISMLEELKEVITNKVDALEAMRAVYLDELSDISKREMEIRTRAQLERLGKASCDKPF